MMNTTGCVLNAAPLLPSDHYTENGEGCADLVL